LVVIDFCFLIYCVMVLASSVFFFFFFFIRILILLMFCSYYFTYFCRIMFSIVFFPFFKEFIIIIIIMYSFHRKKMIPLFGFSCLGFALHSHYPFVSLVFFFSYLIVRMRVKFVSCHFIIWLTVVDCFG